MIVQLAAWCRQNGDETVALVAHYLSTPYTIVRRTPIRLLQRYLSQIVKLARLQAGRM